MTAEEIKAAFKSGDLIYLDAIEALVRTGVAPKEAESAVSEWEESPTITQPGIGPCNQN